MSKRSGYAAGAVTGAILLVSQYVFDIDFGAFVWAIALMTLGFAAALITTPADRNGPAD
jgi:hypothetical protein